MIIGKEKWSGQLRFCHGGADQGPVSGPNRVDASKPGTQQQGVSVIKNLCACHCCSSLWHI